MSLNSVENWLANLGSKLGIGTAISELACELGGIGFLIYQVIMVTENKCTFKTISQTIKENKKSSKIYYLICEDAQKEDISFDSCYGYKNIEDAKLALQFVNQFPETYLLVIGIIWILILLILGFIKLFFENLEKGTTLKNMKILNCIEGLEFLLSFVFGTLIIPITGVNYQDQCASNYFSIGLFSPIFIYYSTYFFLVAGIIVYIIIISKKKYLNPIWALFLLPQIIIKCLLYENENNEDNNSKSQEDKQNERNTKLRIAQLFVLLYIAVIFFNFALTVANSHIAITLFSCFNMVSCILGVFKKEKQIQSGQQ